MSLISEEVRALVGTESEVMRAPSPVELSEIRRMAQAIMDLDPVYWDERVAGKSRYETIVAPALFPLHSTRPSPEAPDVISPIWDDPGYDGAGDLLSKLGFPLLPIGSGRLLNGGYEVEIYALAQVGDQIESKSKILDITEKQGKSGAFALLRVESTYRAVNRDVTLLRSVHTSIFR